jgi:penicillin-binding protein 1B
VASSGSSAKGTRSGRRARAGRWWKAAAVLVGLPAAAAAAVFAYSYLRFAGIIDERLHGHREHWLPRIYGRPLELRRGQWLSECELVERLNDIGYAERDAPARPGEFSAAARLVTFIPRSGDEAGQPVRAHFTAPPPARAGAAPSAGAERLDRLDTGSAGARDVVRLDPPLLTSLMTGEREKRRQVRLAQIPRHVIDAVLAIEDRRFYEHPGIDPIRIVGALVTNLSGERSYLVGGSTITQQLVRNIFLASVIDNPTEKSVRRKVTEQMMAVVLERRASKDEILEFYLNEVYLGQRGSFAIHGVAEGARLMFGKDVTNLSLAEAATIAGVIHSPHNLSPFTSPSRARERRNVVLQEMAQARFITREAAQAASREPLVTVPRALDAEAPYFVDMVGQQLAERFPDIMRSTQQVDVHTSLDLNLQRIAQDSVREGLAEVDALLARRKRRQTAQAALIAVDPRSGEILAWVGGRSYNQSQYNRVLAARRQPGSVFKPFVYLAAFEKAAEEGRTDLTPATIVDDEPTTFWFDDQAYEPRNYEDTYDGPITLRRALAHSRNTAAVKVAEMVGYDTVAALWKRMGTSTVPKPYPSIALGAFEATPYEIATAYTVFPNLGTLRPLHAIERIDVDSREAARPAWPAVKPVTRPETAFLVENMLRSVVNEGTAAAVRASGFALDAAGKTGTTNDLRDAWFAGFTPELLTVVWVGFDDNTALGLSGAQAALPIWTSFMNRALSGHPNLPLPEPGGIEYAEIDKDNGKLAAPGCPRVLREAFLPGTAPTEVCDLHRD